jgi:hypothetical protein
MLPQTMTEPAPAKRENLLVLGFFLVALLTHAWLGTRNMTTPFMMGHEFRQAQTALISYYVDQKNDFSLLYEVPILGKPWVSILLEVPIYEWSVVGLSRVLDLPHYVSARIISLGCFYLCLPAFWLLLGQIGVSRHRRLLTLALILCCPVYIFYSRAFLMESMELMCCAWFLYCFVRMMQVRRWPWFLLTAAAGTGAALIKSATFAVWLLPAAGYVVWWLWRDWRVLRSWSAALQTAFWGLAGVVVALGALRLWIQLTDPIKALHASAWIFTSANLSVGNWGLGELAARVSGQTWGILLERWSEALMPPWVVGLGLIAGLLVFPAERARVAGVAAVFFLAQLMFPFAYAYQEYYYYACGVFLLGALGFVLGGVLDSRLPRWLCWLLLLVLPAAELHTYWRVYYGQQMIKSDGGFSFTQTLRELTPRDSVIIVSGADWAAMIPFYSQRRALMIRNGLGNDPAYLQRAFGDLADEDVAALVLVFDERKNMKLKELAAAEFGLDSEPTFTHEIADIYCNQRYSNLVKEGLKQRGYFGDIKVPNPSLINLLVPVTQLVNQGLAKTAFSMVSPAPLKVRFTYGISHMNKDGVSVLDAHPDSDLWLRPPAGATQIEWDFGMISTAWEKSGDKTQGVILKVVGLLPDGTQRVIFERSLDPVAVEADRGDQRASIAFQASPGEMLQFSVRPRFGYAYCWTYWKKIEVK